MPPEEKTSAKSEDRNPGNRRNVEPKLSVLFDFFCIRTEHHRKESYQEGREKIADHG